MKAFVIGVSSWDTLIYINELPIKFKEDMSLWANKTIQTIGGTGAGKALALDVLGIDVTLATDLSSDEAGEHILNTYKNHPRIDLKILKADYTTTHTNLMHHDGYRLSIFTQTPSEVTFNPSLEADIKDAEIVFLNINAYCKDYLPLIKKYHKKVVVDIHDYDLGNPYHQSFIDIADILFVSGINIKDQTLFLKEHIKGKEVVIITNGKNGSVAIDQSDQFYKQDAFTQLPLIDTNGAGDTFSAAFVTHYLKEHSIQDALKFASIAGAYACASETLYSKDAHSETIEKFMKETF